MEFEPPYTMIVSGQTGSGKTVFFDKLCRNLEETHTKPFDRIVLAYSIMQPIYLKLKADVEPENLQVDLVDGFPEDLAEDNKNTLVIIDDQMLDLADDKRLASMFVKMRHFNISTVFVVQNLYHSGKFMRTIARNSHYLVLFSNPRDSSMIMTLSRQAFPHKSNYLYDAFCKATSKPFSPLIVDFKPTTDNRFRLKEGIFPGEQPYCYLPK